MSLVELRREKAGSEKLRVEIEEMKASAIKNRCEISETRKNTASIIKDDEEGCEVEA